MDKLAVGGEGIEVDNWCCGHDF